MKNYPVPSRNNEITGKRISKKKIFFLLLAAISILGYFIWNEHKTNKEEKEKNAEESKAEVVIERDEITHEEGKSSISSSEDEIGKEIKGPTEKNDVDGRSPSSGKIVFKNSSNSGVNSEENAFSKQKDLDKKIEDIYQKSEYSSLNNKNHPAFISKTEQKNIISRGKAIISFVVLEGGMRKNDNRLLFTLPSSVTLGFSPYSANIKKLLQHANSLGFSTMIHLPTSTTNDKNINPGPLAIKNTNTDMENLKILKEILVLGEGIDGIYLDKEQDITNNEMFESVIMKELKNLNLFLGYWMIRRYRDLKDLNSHPHSDVYNDAKNKIMFDILLDSSLDPEELSSNINKMVKQSLSSGNPMVGAIRSYSMSIKVLKKWLVDNKDSDVVVLPLLSIVDMKGVETTN